MTLTSWRSVSSQRFVTRTKRLTLEQWENTSRTVAGTKAENTYGCRPQHTDERRYRPAYQHAATNVSHCLSQCDGEGESKQQTSRKLANWPDKARVVGSSGPRSYDVELEDGRMIRRNRQHLLLTREPYKPVMDETGETTPGDTNANRDPQRRNYTVITSVAYTVITSVAYTVITSVAYTSSPVLRTPSSPMLRTPSSPVLRTPSSPVLRTPSSPVLRTPSSPVLRTPSSPVLHKPRSELPGVRRYPEGNRKPPMRLAL